jgi:hypothetical protein
VAKWGGERVYAAFFSCQGDRIWVYDPPTGDLGFDMAGPIQGCSVGKLSKDMNNSMPAS